MRSGVLPLGKRFSISILCSRVKDAFARGRKGLLPSARRGNQPAPAAVPRLFFEAMEPRLLLAADIAYGDMSNTPATFADVPGYVATIVSTNYTLRAEEHGGNRFWRLYGTVTDVVGMPPPPTQVAQFQIDDPTDLRVDLKRHDLGLATHDGSFSLIDFVGDKITVDLDSLSVLNGQFAGTPIEIDRNAYRDRLRRREGCRLGCDRRYCSSVIAQRAERPVDHRRRQWQSQRA